MSSTAAVVARHIKCQKIIALFVIQYLLSMSICTLAHYKILFAQHVSYHQIIYWYLLLCSSLLVEEV